jgi:hypothetical protein
MTGSMLFDLQDDLQVMFTNDPKKPLLEGDSCFNRVTISTTHETYEKFAKACMSSITLGSQGYGRF